MGKKMRRYLLLAALFITTPCALMAASGYTVLSPTQIRWYWDIPSGYEVYSFRSKNADGTWTTRYDLSTSATSHVETVASNVLIRERQIVFRSGGTYQTEYPNPSDFFSWCETPGGAEYIARTSSALLLTWTSADAAKPETRFVIERATDVGGAAGAFSAVVTVSSGLFNNIWQNTGLTLATTYYYRIKAYNGDNVPTAYSIVTSTRTTNGDPSTPAFTISAGDRKAILSWDTGSSDGANEYEVMELSPGGEQRTVGNFAKSAGGVTVLLSSYTTTFGAYSYKMRSINIDGEMSSWTALSSVTPTAGSQFAYINGVGQIKYTISADRVEQVVGLVAVVGEFAEGLTKYKLLDVRLPNRQMDGSADYLWAPMAGVVTETKLVDAEGDGTMEIALDINGDNLYERFWTIAGAMTPGTVNVSVKDSKGNAITRAVVTYRTDTDETSKNVDVSGTASFAVPVPIGSRTTLKIEAAGYATYEESILTPSVFGSNNYTVKMRVTSANGEDELSVCPNPLKNTSQGTLIYELNEEQTIRIDILDTELRTMKNLVSGTETAGSHTINFDLNDQDGRRLDKGLYYVVMRAGSSKKIFKMIIQ